MKYTSPELKKVEFEVDSKDYVLQAAPPAAFRAYDLYVKSLDNINRVMARIPTASESDVEEIKQELYELKDYIYAAPIEIIEILLVANGYGFDSDLWQNKIDYGFTSGLVISVLNKDVKKKVAVKKTPEEVDWELLYLLICKHMGAVSREEFFNKWDMDTMQKAIAFIPDDHRQLVFKTYTSVSSLQGGF